MRIVDCEQRSPAWYAARLGVLTASRLDAVMVNGKSDSGFGVGAYTLMRTLTAEMLEGQSDEQPQTFAMKRGIELEPDAKACYTFRTGRTIRDVGFVLHPTLDGVGCSPDGLVGDDGMIEVKCPSGAEHLSFLVDGEIPKQYVAQVQGQLWICRRQWCDFVSYRPECSGDTEGLDLLCLRVYPDAAYHAKLDERVPLFLEELRKVREGMLKNLEAMRIVNRKGA